MHHVKQVKMARKNNVVEKTIARHMISCLIFLAFLIRHCKPAGQKLPTAVLSQLQFNYTDNIVTHSLRRFEQIMEQIVEIIEPNDV